MNYLHAYHAGSFADVVKHVTLTTLLTFLKKKHSPFCYVDTHAGRGFYDLSSEQASKTKTYRGGIEKIIQQEKIPSLIKLYLNIVHRINNQLTHSTYSSLRYYPGSVMIARQLIRPHDRILACELHPAEYQVLKMNFAGDKQIYAHHQDGFQSLKAFLPPSENRGIILVDPPYESPDEFIRVTHTLSIAIKKWERGIYAIWFPIKEKSQLIRFYQNLRSITKRPMLLTELTIYPDLPQHLNGTGMVIINPPWQFEQTMKPLLSWLWNTLSINKQGYYRAQIIK